MLLVDAILDINSNVYYCMQCARTIQTKLKHAKLVHIQPAADILKQIEQEYHNVIQRGKLFKFFYCSINS